MWFTSWLCVLIFIYNVEMSAQDDTQPNNQDIIKAIQNLETLFEDKLSDLLDAKLADVQYRLSEIEAFQSKISDEISSINSKIIEYDENSKSMKNNITIIKSNITTVISTLENTSDIISLIESKITEHCENLENLTKVIEITDDEDTDNKCNKYANENNASKIPCPPTTLGKNCADIHNKGCKTSDPVQICPYSSCLEDCVSVVCDQHYDGGNWTVIQRRQVLDPPRENFYRPWADYVTGFGNLREEFWVGLRLIHLMTHQAPQELHIALEDWDGEKRWARYNHFSVGPAEDNYRLNITGYSGDASDSLTTWHNGQAFSTYDRDNDIWSDGNCAERYNGAWWYNACHWSNPNGLPHRGNDTSPGVGIIWYHWRGYSYSMRSISMMIRPVT